VRKLFVSVILIAVIASVMFLRRQSAVPVIELPALIPAVGQSSSMAVHVRGANGIRMANASVSQNGISYPVWILPQPTKASDNSWSFNLGTSAIPQLKDGKASLVVEATSNDIRRKQARVERELLIVTHPPVVSVDSEQHYLYLGMADLATFAVSGTWIDAGVRVGDQTFRAWPMPAGKPGLFSLFAYAWNTQPGTLPVAYASYGGATPVSSPISFQFPKKEQPKYTSHDLQIDDRFLQKVVGELDPNGPGDMVERFVRINNEMRRANNKTLSDLRLKTVAQFLWSQPFLRQPGAKTEANFADLRHYFHNGKKIDQQVHLGYDLAVTQHVGVQASNDGRVIYAAPLGIYGNCIVVDHGYGLQTIYGHLSRIDVHEGQEVKRGEVMGLSGMTGMAGGDHIHFSMQLDGVQIDPKEWWDEHWIKDHIARRISMAATEVTSGK
jgi:murein DD-endopeptidase MepM/ murein hydrolase activator NlpD